MDFTEKSWDRDCSMRRHGAPGRHVCGSKPQRECKTSDRSSQPLLNPKLCYDCQAWDDITHVTICLKDEYPDIHSEAFSWHPMERNISYKRDLEQLTFHNLDYYSPSKGCRFCSRVWHYVIENILYASKDLNILIATWRPFQLESYPLGKDWECDDNKQYTVKILLPICTAREYGQFGRSDHSTWVMKIEVVYEEPGNKLEDIRHWDLSMINIKTVKEWLSDCQDSHGENCSSLLPTRSLPSSLRLIDTRNWCVIRATGVTEYLALSYIWASAVTSKGTASTDIFQLDSSNAAQLEVPNVLKGNQVPELISDAIQLSADIGYDYLWVDRLCIVQDGGDLKQEQINAMDAIYHNATMTIVALGDGATVGQTGLPGLPKRPRQIYETAKPWNLRFFKEYVGAKAASIWDIVGKSPWNKRGWTYQERVLSRRHLFIGDQSAYLNCSQSYHDLDLPYKGGPESDYGFEQGIRSRAGKFTYMFDEYIRAIQGYTQRTLSYDEDTLNAFLGAGNALSAQHQTGLLFGLPEKYIFPALCWRHDYYWRKRKPSVSGTIPSWSWAAYVGDVSYYQTEFRFRSAAFLVQFGRESSVGSLVKFYYTDPEKGLRTIKALNPWFPSDGEQESGDNGKSCPDYSEAIESEHDKYFRRITSRGDESVGVEDKSASVEMWKRCIQSPWEADKHTEVNDHDGSLTQAHPRCLVFNTTYMSLILEDPSSDGNPIYRRFLKLRRPEPSILSERQFDLVDSESNSVIGQTSKTYGQETFELFQPGTLYGVAVLGACCYEPTHSSGPDLWGLIVMIVERQNGVSRRLAIGVADPQAWTEAGANWERIILA